MTKPCRFPERINQRRRSALTRLEARLATPLPWRVEWHQSREDASKEADRLALLIVPTARNRHTKKNSASSR